MPDAQGGGDVSEALAKVGEGCSYGLRVTGVGGWGGRLRLGGLEVSLGVRTIGIFTADREEHLPPGRRAVLALGWV